MYVVYNIVSAQIYSRCKTLPGAKRSARKANFGYGNPQYDIASQEDYDTKVNVMTTTYNMMDPERKPIPIRLADKGGCCDPATETYHSM